MSVKAMNWAWDQKVGNPTRKAILVKLADHADADGVCWPGHRGIAEYVEVDRRTVIRQIAKLRDDGFIDVHQRRDGGGRQTSNLYRLLMNPGDKLSPRPGDADDTPSVTSETDQSDASVTGSVSPVSHEPKGEPTTETSDEHELARALLAAFNTENGSHYPLDAQLEKLVTQIRRHPELTESDHLGIVITALSSSWLRESPGSPSPSAIWGRPDLFDSHVEAWRREAGTVPAAPATFDLLDDESPVRGIWQAVLNQLEATLETATFRMWVQPVSAIGVDGDVLVVTGPANIRQWFPRRYGSMTLRALAGVPGGDRFTGGIRFA